MLAFSCSTTMKGKNFRRTERYIPGISVRTLRRRPNIAIDLFPMYAAVITILNGAKQTTIKKAYKIVRAINFRTLFCERTGIYKSLNEKS
jgi:hypothetical protein